ncbi:hypothetical protein [Frigoribacterium sp. PhB24]|uniref:hypothetical protein n=1 Tax=Frigoribacterium sp. PhB24 TaxID=2485204 RepID=UPI000F467D7F|nr:hypothetical protein [Frigoribacterium sp. PhB24]
MEHTDPMRCELRFTATHGDGAPETIALRSGVADGSLVRIHRGVYAATSDWEGLDSRERHVLLTRGMAAGAARNCVVSHVSAVAALGLPRVHDRFDDTVTVTDPRRTSTKTSTHLLRRPGEVPTDDVLRLGDLSVTALRRTAVDVARTAPFADAVLCADAVLRRLVLPNGHRTGPSVTAAVRREREGLLGRLGPTTRPGNRAARRAVQFSSPFAENGGESLLRVVLFELGLSNVELQREFRLADGRVARCDTYLASHGVAVELNGLVKSTDPRMLAGRTPAEVVRDRTRRDRALCRLPEVRAVVNCDYLDLVFPERLGGLLRDADVDLDRRRVTAAAREAARRFRGDGP